MYVVAVLFLLPAVALAQDTLMLKLKGDMPDDVQNNVRILVDASRYACQPSKSSRASLERQVKRNATRALQGVGYFNSELTTSWKDSSKKKGCDELTLTVIVGEPTLIETLDIQINGEAKTDEQFALAQTESGLVKGQILQQNRYDDLRRRLQQLLIDRGYAEGDLVARRLEINREKNTARIVLIVESGPRYSFGNISFEGETQLNASLLQRFLQFQIGQPFSQRQLLDTQQAYLGAGYFSAVRMIRSEPNAAERSIDITVYFSERNRWALLSGIGVSTDTGPRLRLGVENRRVNRFGHTARAETKVSGVSQGVGTGYQMPLRDPVNEKLDLHTGYLNEKTDTSESESLNVGADYIVRTPKGWVMTTSLSYLKEIYAVADQTSRANLVIPGFQMVRIKANDRIYPTKGWKLGFKVRGAAEPLWSSASFAQYDVWGKAIVPVPLIGGRLMMRGQVAATQVTNIRELPASLRFFAGGDSSVRGFAYQSLGPKNDDGDVIGGRDLLIGSVEYDHRLGQQWALAVFSDVGNAFNNFSDYEVERSVGTGVRWISPLGPIRLDIASGLKSNQGWRLHLSMGPDL